MLIAWFIGFIMNLIALYIWYNSYEDEERIPINIILFIVLVILAILPIINIISGISLVIVLIDFLTNGLEFRGPKWMHKEIK